MTDQPALRRLRPKPPAPHAVACPARPGAADCGRGWTGRAATRCPRSRGRRWRAWPPTCAGRPTPSKWIGRCSSSSSWEEPESASRRCSTPWPAAPSPAPRSPGRPRATPSSITTNRSSPTGSTPPCATAGSRRTTGLRWRRRSSSIRPTSTATTWPTARSCIHVLPVADVVLYVGSQEKYHDEIGWQLFLQQRQAAGVRLRHEQVGPLRPRRRQRPAARRRLAARPEVGRFREPAAVPHLRPGVARRGPSRRRTARRRSPG